MSINICPMVALAAELTNVPLWLCIPLHVCFVYSHNSTCKRRMVGKVQTICCNIMVTAFIIPFAVKYGAGTAAETVLECLVNDYLTFIVLLLVCSA